jgi:hypothetical protein
MKRIKLSYSVIFFTIVIVALLIHANIDNSENTSHFEIEKNDANEMGNEASNNQISSGYNERGSIESAVLNGITQIYNSDDLYYVALEHLDRAKAGSAESQYILYEILKICDLSKLPYSSHLSSQEPAKLFDVMYQWDKKCSGFNEQSVQLLKHSEENGWLFSSFNQEYPIAIIEVIASRKKIKLFEKEHDKKINIDSLVLTVLNSKNIYALDRLRWLDNDNSTHMSWKLLACDMGLDCVSQTPQEQIAAIYQCEAKKSLSNSECYTSSTFEESLRNDLSEVRYREVLSRAEKLKQNVLLKNKITGEDLKNIFPKGYRN